MGVVLVHGPWAWDGEVAELERLDVPVDAVELPFSDFPDDAGAARAAIERAGPGVVVCGHSYGGFVISAAARGLPVGHLVYLCAFMVDVGEEPMSLWFGHPVPLHGAMLEQDGRSIVDPARATECFYADADAGDAAAAVARLRSIPGTDGPPIDGADPAWRAAPSTYVVCGRDQAIHPDAQRTMARHADHVVEWDADHSPFLSDPARVATLLAELAAVSATA